MILGHPMVVVVPCEKYYPVWPQGKKIYVNLVLANFGRSLIWNIDIYKQQYKRKYKYITVGTQVITINTTARMATAYYGNQKISTVNLYWLWVDKPFNISTVYQQN